MRDNFFLCYTGIYNLSKFELYSVLKLMELNGFLKKKKTDCQKCSSLIFKLVSSHFK